MRKVIKFLLALLLVLSLGSESIVIAANVDNTDKADAMKAIGLFSGTSKGYELDRAPTRLEAAVMLVRLLGKETEARSVTSAHPFTDVPKWADPYVGFMYSNDLTAGIGNNLFGSDKFVDSKSYMTFVLRALGYSDSNGDFTWTTAMEFAVKKGLLSDTERKNIIGQSFLRDELVYLSYKGLKGKLKDEPNSLADKLIENGIIEPQAAVTNGFIDKEKYRAVLSPKVRAEGEFTGIDTTQDVFIYNEGEANFFNYINGSGVQLSLPKMEGWDNNLVARLDF